MSATDALARAAEAGIHCLAIPTPFQVGRVNTYLIDDDPLTLLDTGPNSGTSLDALERALADHGRRIEDLELIVLSHQHMDHLGLASILARRSGAQIAALDLLAPWVAHYGRGMDADDAFAERVMAEHGIPEDVRLALLAASHAYRALGAACTVTQPLTDGGVLTFGDRTLRVLHRPGHSPSDTIFHDEQRGIVLGADHLIKHISSNPLISRPLDVPLDDDPPARPPALEIYLASMRATREMQDVSLVLAGHGEPVTDHVALIDERLAMHRRRARKIRRLLEEGPRTAYEVAQALWGTVAVTQAYLTLSEVLGHADLLVADGAVVEERGDDGVVRLRAAGQGTTGRMSRSAVREPADVAAALADAMNAHDIEAFVALFAEDYDSRQPAHPDRAFQGREQVRENWSAVFSGVPDFRAELVALAVSGESAWTEWRWRGTELDMAGVIVLGVRDGEIAWARLYVEPVEQAGAGIEAAVDRMAGRD
ncbi:MAG TPA: nuclear transport factor 2 family protein [Solirubrobacteraceae bacterium]|nr:nuclear transport factor 2 family protein [Solirubrobacteraceae bacterium]